MTKSDLPRRRGQFRVDGAQRQVVDRRSLARHAVMVHGIGTVGANLHLEDSVLAFAADALDGNSNRSKVLRQAAIVHLGIHELAQPCGRKFHFAAFELLALSLQLLGLLGVEHFARSLKAEELTAKTLLIQTVPKISHPR